MPELVQCARCGHKLSSDSGARLDGALLCPPCYAKRKAEIKAEKSETAERQAVEREQRRQEEEAQKELAREQARTLPKGTVYTRRGHDQGHTIASMCNELRHVFAIERLPMTVANVPDHWRDMPELNRGDLYISLRIGDRQEENPGLQVLDAFDRGLPFVTGKARLQVLVEIRDSFGDADRLSFAAEESQTVGALRAKVARQFARHVAQLLYRRRIMNLDVYGYAGRSLTVGAIGLILGTVCLAISRGTPEAGIVAFLPALMAVIGMGYGIAALAFMSARKLARRRIKAALGLAMSASSAVLCLVVLLRCFGEPSGGVPRTSPPRVAPSGKAPTGGRTR